MNVNKYLPGSIIICCIIGFCSCEEKPRTAATRFTKADSLTETYLTLKDSMLQAWNVMINDDNQKLEAMQNLLHELSIGSSIDKELLKTYEERVQQLKKSRYTQKTMGNVHIVEEYDFASNALVSELISLAESQTQFAYNSTLQKLVDEIRSADLRTNNYRDEYDLIAASYNEFLEHNREFLKDIEEDSFMEKKPLFKMVAE